MPRRFSKAVLLGLVLAGASCSNFSWIGRGGGVDSEAAALGVKDVKALERDYETQRYWATIRRRAENRKQALKAGFRRIQETFDRHFLNNPWEIPADR